jgi:hypothetical protein
MPWTAAVSCNWGGPGVCVGGRVLVGKRVLVLVGVEVKVGVKVWVGVLVLVGVNVIVEVGRGWKGVRVALGMKIKVGSNSLAADPSETCRLARVVLPASVNNSQIKAADARQDKNNNVITNHSHATRGFSIAPNLIQVEFVRV